MHKHSITIRKYSGWAVLLLLQAAAWGADSQTPLIHSAMRSQATHPSQVTIRGRNFGGVMPWVKLDGQSLKLLLYTSNTIVAEVPAAIDASPGTYLLTVSRGDSSSLDDKEQRGEFALAIGPLPSSEVRSGLLHIVKDCREESGIPGSDFCTVVSSNLPELPAGTQIYYDLSAGPTPGPGYFDQNIFVFVSPSQWAVGRCTGPNDINTLGTGGLCRLSDGVGRLAGFTARVDVTWVPPAKPTDNPALFAWEGTYTFNSLPAR